MRFATALRYYLFILYQQHGLHVLLAALQIQLAQLALTLQQAHRQDVIANLEFTTHIEVKLADY